MLRAGLLVALFALLAVTPTVAAQQPDFVRAVYADYDFRRPVGEFQENASLQTRDPDPCTAGHFELDEQTRTITFDESLREGECGEIGAITNLPRAENVFIIFSADRNITQEFSVPTPVDAPQELRIYDANGALLTTYAYISPSSGNTPQQLYFLELTSLGHDRLNLTWFFEDRGAATVAGLPNAAVGQGFESVVTDPRLLVQQAQLPFQALGSNQNTVGDKVINKTFVQVNLQEVLRPGASNFTVRVVTNPNAVLEEVRAPDSQALDLRRLSTRVSDAGYEVEIRHEDLQGHGAGNLLFVFRTESPVPPAAAPVDPPEPMTIYPFAFLLLALPAVPAAFATRTSLGLRRSADARHRPFVTHVFGVDLAFIALYVGLFVYVLAREQVTAMAHIPLALEGWLLYIQFVALTLLFVFLWVAPTRHLVVLMRRDLAMSEQAQNQLRRSNAELEQFAYIASHDLQEPLRTIAGFSEILRTKYGHKLDAKAQQYLAMNAQGAKRMQNLIHGLLAYSRVESKPLEKVEVDLNEVMTDIIRDVDRLREEQGGSILVRDLPHVYADPVQMRQLFLNLVQNALKYRHPGRKPEVWIGAERDEDYHILYVRDNGKGIEPQHSEKVFEMFHRLEPRDSPVPGTGLGLAVVKKIVARHDGKVWVEPIPGGGSIFKVALPRRR